LPWIRGCIRLPQRMGPRSNGAGSEFVKSGYDGMYARVICEPQGIHTPNTHFSVRKESVLQRWMARTFDSPRHDALREFLVKKRKEAGLRQVDLAKRLKRRQDYINYVETEQKLVEVVELMEWAEAIGFYPKDAIKALAKIRK
jgi:hypothetical protein